MKKCNVCKLELIKENCYLIKGQFRNKCKVCWSFAVRKWKDENKDKYREQKRNNARKNRKTGYLYELAHPRDLQKNKARSLLHYAVQTGKIVRPKYCQECNGKPDVGIVEAHHDDYLKPYEVRWLCPRCHRVTDGKYERKWNYASL